MDVGRLLELMNVCRLLEPAPFSAPCSQELLQLGSCNLKHCGDDCSFPAKCFSLGGVWHLGVAQDLEKCFMFPQVPLLSFCDGYVALKEVMGNLGQGFQLFICDCIQERLPLCR